jgi:hypothetical protein
MNVQALGWHYIARVRGNQTLQLPDSRAFISVEQLYKKARTTPQCLGKIKLTSSQRYVITAVLVGTHWKLRKRDKHKSYKEPWLLVSLLSLLLLLPSVFERDVYFGNAVRMHGT